MKKNILVLFVLISIFFTACTKNNPWIEYVASTELTDSSEDKGQNISQPFQLYKGRIYMIGAEWMEGVDLETKKQISKVKKKGDNFYIANDNIYFLEYKNKDCVSYCPLSNTENGKSEIYWNNISSMLILNNEMIGLRTGDKYCTLLKYDGEMKKFFFDLKHK